MSRATPPHATPYASGSEHHSCALRRPLARTTLCAARRSAPCLALRRLPALLCPWPCLCPSLWCWQPLLRHLPTALPVLRMLELPPRPHPRHTLPAPPSPAACASQGRPSSLSRDENLSTHTAQANDTKLFPNPLFRLFRTACTPSRAACASQGRPSSPPPSCPPTWSLCPRRCCWPSRTWAAGPAAPASPASAAWRPPRGCCASSSSSRRRGQGRGWGRAGRACWAAARGARRSYRPG